MRRYAHVLPRILLAGLACSMASSILQADELDELKRKLEQQKEIAELRKQIAQADRDAAAAIKETATSQATGTYTDAATISGAKSKIATDEAAEQFAELTALKTIMGDPKKIGVDGSIAFTSDKQNIMLQSRQGGIEVTREAATTICRAMQNNRNITAVINANNKRIVPLSEQRLGEIVAAKLRIMRVNALLDTIKELSPESSTPRHALPNLPNILEWANVMSLEPYSMAGAIVAAQQAQYLLQGIDNVAGAFRVNRTFTMDTTARADLFESRLAACSDIFLPLSLARSADRRRLGTLVEEFAKKLQTLQIFAADVAIERKQFDSLPKAQQTEAKNEKIRQRESIAARVNTLNYTDDTLLQDLALASMEQDIRDHPIMTYSLSIQDIQIMKERFLRSNKLNYQGTAEVVYQVTGTSGQILDGDAVSLTSATYSSASTNGVRPSGR